MQKGMVIGGGYNNILAREKRGKRLELGQLLLTPVGEGKILLQVVDLLYGSQISQQDLELVSGMKLEQDSSLGFMEPHLRNYVLAKLKSLVLITADGAVGCKSLPEFFSFLDDVREDDISFLTKPENPLMIGMLRSGSKVLEMPIYLRGDDVFSHHVLIPAATGKGKSNLCSVMLWQATGQEYCGILVLDPHDEYFERLRDHPNKDKIVYYTSGDVPPGGRSLKINVSLLLPQHLHGAVSWTDAQHDAVQAYYRIHGNKWVEAVLLEQNDRLDKFHEATLGVVKRKLSQLLGIDGVEGKLHCDGIFDTQSGEGTVREINRELEAGKTVIVDTSAFDGAKEILIGSLVSTEVLNNYKRYKRTGELDRKPVISVFIEEAPRVLGKEILKMGPNIFSTIAREGRKFKIGLTAITQLPSLIPREILANINTKIILGMEMKPERHSLIESAAQDLSEDDRTIASLDKGEALVTSTFARFATPVKVPLFSAFKKKELAKNPAVAKAIEGMS